jgi:tetratricopeptide (TPR) repeat protein
MAQSFGALGHSSANHFQCFAQSLYLFCRVRNKTQMPRLVPPRGLARVDNRADAFVKLKNYPKAIEDISKSIERSLASYAFFSMNIDQFRKVYPEYDSVPDDVLCEKLRTLFYPSMKYTDFAEQFLVQAHEFTSTVLPDLYLKRGDAYAAMGQKVKANLEYDRVSRGFPDSAPLHSLRRMESASEKRSNPNTNYPAGKSSACAARSHHTYPLLQAPVPNHLSADYQHDTP